MKHEELASKFQLSVDTVVNKYHSEHKEYLAKKPPSELRRQRQHPDIHPTITGFLGDRWTDIVEMEVFEEVCDYALLNFDMVERYHFRGQALQWGIDHILLGFISDVLGQTGSGLEYSEEDFQTVYEHYETDLLSETLPQRTFICLQGVTLEEGLEQVELADNVVIQEMTDRDYARVAESSSPESIFAKQEQHDRVLKPISGPRLRYILEVWLDIDKEDLLPEEEPDGAPDYVSKRYWSVRNAVTALRLVNREGTVNYGQRFSEGMGAWQNGVGGGMGWNQPIAWLAEYELTQEDVEDVRQMFGLLQSKDFESIDTDLRMAVERFNSATLRQDWRIEFSDLIIIMEALLSKKSALPGRELAQRAAILLGDSLEERQDIYDAVKELWEIRGSVWGVAHGGGRTTLEEQDKFLEKARHYATECLVQILELERSHGGLSNLLKAMDERINESMLGVEFPG